MFDKDKIGAYWFPIRLRLIDLVSLQYYDRWPTKNWCPEAFYRSITVCDAVKTSRFLCFSFKHSNDATWCDRNLDILARKMQQKITFSHLDRWKGKLKSIQCEIQWFRHKLPVFKHYHVQTLRIKHSNQWFLTWLPCWIMFRQQNWQIITCFIEVTKKLIGTKLKHESWAFSSYFW